MRITLNAKSELVLHDVLADFLDRAKMPVSGLEKPVSSCTTNERTGYSRFTVIRKAETVTSEMLGHLATVRTVLKDAPTGKHLAPRTSGLARTATVQ